MMKIIAAAAFVAAPWQLAHAQAIIGSIPEEFRGDWCQESTKDNIFKPGGCKLKAGSLSIDRMTLDTGRLSCGFDSGAASEGELGVMTNTRMPPPPPAPAPGEIDYSEFGEPLDWSREPLR